jgi:succinylglutamate desuccinylase
VPEGSKINASEPSGFVLCPAGTRGNTPTPNEMCEKCVSVVVLVLLPIHCRCLMFFNPPDFLAQRNIKYKR